MKLCPRCGDEMEDKWEVEFDIVLDDNGEHRKQKQRVAYACPTCGHKEAEPWLKR